MSQTHDSDGHCKHLAAGERERFLQASAKTDAPARTFCLCLAHSGCRISKALQLTAERIDLDEGVLVFETLKKRIRGQFRRVPAPDELLDALELAYGIRRLQRGRTRSGVLWNWSRTTAWRKVSVVMKQAGIDGPQASPKGLRHGFGIAAIEAGVPLNLLQKWLGHAQMETTAIYANALGVEERQIAARMWRMSGTDIKNAKLSENWQK